MGHSYKGRAINPSAVTNQLRQVVLSGQGTGTIAWSVSGTTPVSARIEIGPTTTGPWSPFSTVSWALGSLAVGANNYRVTGLDLGGTPNTIPSLGAFYI